eukprot:m.255607 g.255607  ORF g.255607 m.255607 type:complete len:141 (+) comp19623_c0_seq1:99-521(+)
MSQGRSLLVSPATAGSGIPWLTQFFGNCTELYGPGGCNISRVAVHDYSCNVTNIMTYLRSVYVAFRLPIWLTEFACGLPSQGRSVAEQEAYMRALVPVLDATSYIERYAWFASRQGNPCSLLGPPGSGSLTRLGSVYVSL